MASPGPHFQLGQPVRVRLDREMTEAVKAHAKALSAATGKPLGVSAALRDIIGRGLKVYRSKSERDLYAAAVHEGWLAAMSDIRRRLEGSFSRTTGKPSGSHERDPGDQ
jgi:hypothetical protein